MAMGLGGVSVDLDVAPRLSLAESIEYHGGDRWQKQVLGDGPTLLTG